ncbi:MAG: aspartate kinase [Methylococcaceae bacterium NSP1-2]|nr:MAG: aspartate kinase [Methylococcaceae bacterium NSP1-2]
MVYQKAKTFYHSEFEETLHTTGLKMALYVYKFGGTSVGNVERIKAVAEKVKKAHDLGDQIVVVLSAMSGETNRLIGLAKQMQVHPTERELDVLISTGEQVTVALLSMALHELGCEACSYTGSQVKILTDSSYTKARIRKIDDDRIHADLNTGKVVVVAGFQGIDEQGNITTLGRGGSDTTAVALAAALKADECHIYTDVDGVYTTDPRVEPKARRLDRITFEEMLEMASLGSKVLQIRSVEFAGKYNVALRVLSSFKEGCGTLITYEESQMESALISGIAFNRDEAKLTITGVPDLPGVAFKILGPIADANIEVDMIVQNIADDATTDFTFTVHRNDYQRAKSLLEQTCATLGARKVTADDSIVKVSIVGVGMRSHAGIASTMFQALAAEGINIRMIATSEIKISVVVDEKYLELAVRALHAAFKLEQGSED